MIGLEQRELFTVSCPRCGKDLRQVARQARAALDGMKLALPSALSEGVRALDDCLSGSCTPKVGAVRAPDFELRRLTPAELCAARAWKPRPAEQESVEAVFDEAPAVTPEQLEAWDREIDHALRVARATPAQRAAAATSILPIIRAVPAELEREAWIQRAAQRLDVDPWALRVDLGERHPNAEWTPDALRLVAAALRALRAGCPTTAIAALEDALAEMDRGRG